MNDAQPAATMAEYKERAKRVWDEFGTLKNGESRMAVIPAFDFFHVPPTHPDKKYGQHSATLVFAKRKGRKAVSVEFFTSWSVGNRMPMDFDGKNGNFMCTGLYTHHRFKKDADKYAYANDDCPYTGGKCYGEAGSALYGDVILDRLINEGSYGVWDEIDKELAR